MNEAKSLWQEFTGFALKGNIIDLAVAVVIGGAFGNVVNSMVKNVIMPLVSYLITPARGSYRAWHLGRVEIGAFLGELLNFLIIAGTMYVVMIKLLGLVKKAGLRFGPDEPATKECPMCLSVIPYRARKCGHCTADLPALPCAGAPCAEEIEMGATPAPSAGSNHGKPIPGEPS